jgi:carbamoyl-phosphate synthase small subunit
VTHRSLFDNTIQGLKHTTKPIITLQGHPEANPGPHDAAFIFDDFLTLLRHHAGAR